MKMTELEATTLKTKANTYFQKLVEEYRTEQRRMLNDKGDFLWTNHNQKEKEMHNLKDSIESLSAWQKLLVKWFKKPDPRQDLVDAYERALREYKDLKHLIDRHNDHRRWHSDPSIQIEHVITQSITAQVEDLILEQRTDIDLKFELDAIIAKIDAMWDDFLMKNKDEGEGL